MKILCFILFFIAPLVSAAQTVNIMGSVENSAAEVLPLATVLVLPDSTITSADDEGRFSVRTQKGRKEIVITYTGYETFHQEFDLEKDSVFGFVLRAKVSHLQAVTIDANRYSSEDLVQSTQTGTTTLTQKDLTGIPVLGGEADLIKTLQLLPGTVRGVEGSSDLFVRGGAADQNLVLLDGAPIYNTSHLFGFLSVFNPSILDNVEAINGGFPAEYGGRLSSILNISTNAALAERTRISGDVGLIASRLYVEQPLMKDKVSVWVAGRRTYIDQVVKTIGEELPYFFYDINAKLILQPSARDKIEISYYGGEDILDIFRDRNNDGNGFFTSYSSGNSSQSFRWAHSFPSEWKGSLALTRSAYQYNISNNFEENQLLALSDIEDYSARVIFRKDGTKGSAFQIGAEWTRHAISPNIINTTGTISELLESSASRGRLSHEVSLHLQEEWSLTPRLLINAGFRASAGMIRSRNYFVPEPRLSMRLAMSKHEALKFSYSRMAQYMHRISNSAVTTPTDVWYTVTDEIGPQSSHQVATAWQRFISRGKVFLSMEAYYKTMRNLIGYEEGTNLFFNTDFESRLIQGSGRAYGVELLARKESGKLTGWISYTLSWSRRHFEQINNGDWFPARYDRRHNGAVVAQYGIGTRWAVSLVWEFISGARFTPIVGQYVVLAPTLTGMDLIPIYSGINQVKLADTHRLDVGIKFMSKPGKKFQWHWFAGVYNVYNRASPVGIIIEQSDVDGSLRYLQPGLFGMLPFISYGFSI
ncbi:MAG: TonB-dependent receptor plug domain-containing protein [Chryseosolibacter sp.]